MGLWSREKSDLFDILDKETAIPPTLPLSPAEIASFQALVKPAILLLLMLRLDRPVGARELADILGLDEHTIAKYLRTLGKLNLVKRTRYRDGYRLVPGSQNLFGADRIVNNLQLGPVNTAEQIYLIQKSEDLLTAVDDHDDPGQQETGKANRESLEVLRKLGIGEPKRSALANLPHISPSYIKAWHAHLDHVKGEAYRPGLLIHVLETGDPAPEVGENGHPLDCTCDECCPLICTECHIYPCDCD